MFESTVVLPTEQALNQRADLPSAAGVFSTRDGLRLPMLQRRVQAEFLPTVVRFILFACVCSMLSGSARASDIPSSSKMKSTITLTEYFLFEADVVEGIVNLPTGDDAVVALTITSESDGRVLYSAEVPTTRDENSQSAGFTFPIKNWHGGYYRVDASGADPIYFVISQSDQTSVVDSTDDGRYLSFVVDTADRLLSEQSLHLGNDPNGPPFLVVCNESQFSYRSIGERVNGRYVTFWFPEQPFEYNPVRHNIESWPVLDELSRITGSDKYAELVNGMAGAFAEHGFDPHTRLAYFGEEADFDVVHQRGMGKGAYGYDLVKFKPGISGALPALPLDRLWDAAPRQMADLFKAMFYGMITDPGSMDYNRFTRFDLDFENKKSAQVRSSSHCAFGSVGARATHWWASAFVRTGDREYLDWARRMFAKWQAVQHPVSGLTPEYFGGSAYNNSPEMRPVEYAGARDSAMAATAWMQASIELRKHPEGMALADEIKAMAIRMGHGLARHAYDRANRRYPEYMHLNGDPYQSAARYTFYSEAEKREAVKDDASLQQVPVFTGLGLYREGGYWTRMAGSEIPLCLAWLAAETGDAELTEAARQLVPDIMDEASRLTSAFSMPEHRWTFRASADYIKMMLHLHKASGDAIYLQHARTLADMELTHLGAVQYPHWWRQRDRTVLMHALLDLHKAIHTTDVN